MHGLHAAWDNVHSGTVMSPGNVSQAWNLSTIEVSLNETIDLPDVDMLHAVSTMLVGFVRWSIVVTNSQLHHIVRCRTRSPHYRLVMIALRVFSSANYCLIVLSCSSLRIQRSILYALTAFGAKCRACELLTIELLNNRCKYNLR